MTSPTQRSLELLRDAGYTVEVAEHWNNQAGVRQDLFRCIDIIGLHPDETGVLGVQTTTSDHVAEHVKKIQGIPAAALWMKCGNSICVHGWKKYAKPLAGKWWRCREIWFLPDMRTKEERG